MKKAKNYLIAMLLPAFIFAGCGGGSEEPELTDQQKATKALTGSWGGARKVTIDSPPKNLEESDYQSLNSLKLTFNSEKNEPTSFVANGGGQIFPNVVGGSWEWSSSDVIAITGGEISQLTGFKFLPGRDNATAIQFTFHYDQAAGKVLDLSGDYTVTLSK